MYSGDNDDNCGRPLNLQELIYLDSLMLIFIDFFDLQVSLLLNYRNVTGVQEAINSLIKIVSIL